MFPFNDFHHLANRLFSNIYILYELGWRLPEEATEWVGWSRANVTDAQLGLVWRGHRCQVGPFSIYEIAALPTRGLKYKFCLICAPLCEQRESSQLLLASSRRPCGQPDGFISDSSAALSQKLRGGRGRGQQANRCPRGAQTKKRQQQDGCNQRSQNICVITRSSKRAAGCDSVVAVLKVERRLRLQWNANRGGQQMKSTLVCKLYMEELTEEEESGAERRRKKVL